MNKLNKNQIKQSGGVGTGPGVVTGDSDTTYYDPKGPEGPRKY